MVETPLRTLTLGLIPNGWQGLVFEPFREGIQIHRLYGDGQDGPAAAILNYAPGGRAPLHEHTGYEHILMLAGSQQDEHGVYGPGSFVVNPPGSRHSVWSEEGCTALLIWERPVRFVENAEA